MERVHAAVIISFAETGLYNLAHFKFLMELPTSTPSVPIPMNLVASVPGRPPPRTAGSRAGGESRDESTGSIENDGMGSDLLEAFGVAGIVEDFNEWAVSISEWDKPSPAT